MALFMNKKTKIIVDRPIEYANHPVFKEYLVLVEDSATIELAVETDSTSEPLTSAAETVVASDTKLTSKPVKERNGKR